MQHLSRVQVIQRGNGTRQFYIMCPAQLAGDLGIQKGERIAWVVQDRYTIEIHRERPEQTAGAPDPGRGPDHAVAG